MSRKKRALLLLLLMPAVMVGAIIWGYNNYLYDLDASCPSSGTAGGVIPVDIDVGSNAGAVVHVELKGAYSWGDWVYTSDTFSIPSGITNQTVSLNIPVKLLVEPTCEFYIYVYVTMPGDLWGSEAWGIRRDVIINAPDSLTQGEVTEVLSHLKYLVYTSTELPPGIQKNLLSSLDEIAMEFEEGYTPEKAIRMGFVLDLLMDLKCLTSELPPNFHNEIHFIVASMIDYIEN